MFNAPFAVTWRHTCLIWCYVAMDWVGCAERIHLFSFGHARPRMKNRPPCAAARCCICLVSCHACGLMCNGACAWRRISTPRSRATFQDREMLIKIMVRWWKEHSSTSTIMQSGHGNFISKWFWTIDAIYIMINIYRYHAERRTQVHDPSEICFLIRSSPSAHIHEEIKSTKKTNGVVQIRPYFRPPFGLTLRTDIPSASSRHM